MKKNTLAWFVVAGASIALSGMGMAACSSSSATPVGGGGNDASTGGDGSGGKDGSTSGDGGGGGDSGGGDSGTCGSTPTLHKTTDDAGHSDIFCSPATGSPTYCEVEAGTLNHCCIDTSGTGFPDGQCSSGACTYTKGLDIQCLDDQGCGGGQHCCGIGHPYLNSTCSYEKIYGFTGTTCAADCAANAAGIDAGGFQACSSTDTTCTSGTCTPAKEYIQLGVCVQ
ncbi:MAG: hypothetical protein ACRELY_07790 [Polyangiaceae bacterium]